MTPAELAILSLIAEMPRYGYEIEQIIEERGMREWTEISFSSIYYLLKKLEKDGLIEAELEKSSTGGPARKVYFVTPVGESAWVDATLQALSQPQAHRMPLLIGLGSLPALKVEDAVAALQQYARQANARRQSLMSRWERPGVKGNFQVDAMFELSLALIKTEQEWVEIFINRLKQRASSASTKP